MKKLVWVLLLVVFLAFSCKVVKNEKSDALGKGGVEIYFAADGFDAKGFVDGIWDEKLLPYMDEKAVALRELLDGLKNNPMGTSKKYGYRAVGETNPYNFSVTGRVKVINHIRESNGKLEVDVEPFDGVADAVLQVGPIFRGSSLRDILDFVKFEDFTNQVEFAKLATVMNFKVRDSVVKDFAFKENDYRGAEFVFTGATTFENGNINLQIVPVRMEQVVE